MHSGRRAIFLFLVTTTLACGVIAVGCSDSHPPGASDGNGGTHFETVDGGERDGATTSDAATDGGDAASDTGFPCLDDTSVTIDGGAGTTDCPKIPSCSAYCARIATRYKRGVAQTAVDCITKLGTCADPYEPRNCVDLALGRACGDATAKTYCTPLVTACDPNAGGAGSNITESDCEVLASAMTSTGRMDLASCLQGQITAGTCPNGAVMCTTSIRE